MSDGVAFFGGIALVVVLVLLAIFGAVVGLSRVGKHYDRVNCASFGEQSERQVKFVTYSFWSWDCLTPTADGKWISTSNLREFGEQP